MEKLYIEDLAWKLFEETGEIRYYLLYKRTMECDDVLKEEFNSTSLKNSDYAFKVNNDKPYSSLDNGREM
jgi:hypothetical protein